MNRTEALESAISRIQKTYGQGAIMKLGEQPTISVPVIPTGSIALDVATGIGGLPKGRVLEVYGPESSGKTTLTLSVIAQAQKMGGTAAFIDVEHALDPTHAKRMGVDIDSMLISQPGTAEEALEIAEALTKSGAVDIIVIDSVAALVPRAEIEGAMGDSHVGLQARLMSQALRKLTACVSSSRTLLIFINQIREKIGVMFGNPETTSGGRALKFYSSMRLEVRKGETLKNGTDMIGAQVRVKIVKNKVAPPFRTATFDLYFNEGISRESDIIEVGVTHGIVERAGAWISYQGERLGQGRENARQTLIANPELTEKIYREILVKALGIVEPAAEVVEEEPPSRKETKSVKAKG